MKTKITIAFIGAMLWLPCSAQTMSDPFPMIGNQAQAIAATTMINSHIGPNGAPRNCAKRTQWERHMNHRSVCRKSALKYPVGKERQLVRNYCDSRYPALEYPGCG
jgi:hypothetical protein